MCGPAVLLALGLSAQVPALTWQELTARLRPGAGEIAAQAELAAARAALATTSRRLAEGPELALAAGPRRVDGATRTDLELEAAWQLLAANTSRPELAQAVAAAERLLPAAARLETERTLRGAVVAVTRAAALAALRARDLALVDAWLVLTRTRIAAGAEAPYEAELAALELEGARLALATAEVEHLRAWAELAALAEVPASPVPLAAEPPPPAGGDSPRCGLLCRALEAAAELEVASLGLATAREQSRWALRSNVASEAGEEVARLGVAYRLPLAGEAAAAEAARRAAGELARKRARVEIATLEARLARAAAIVASAATTAPAADLERTLLAITARLEEGKVRPSEALLLRRQILSAEEARVERNTELALALAELHTLTTEEAP